MCGLSFFRRTSAGTINLVSLHRPDQLCWSWLLNWAPWPFWFPKFYRQRGRNGGGWGIGPLWFEWQNDKTKRRAA